MTAHGAAVVTALVAGVVATLVLSGCAPSPASTSTSATVSTGTTSGADTGVDAGASAGSEASGASEAAQTALTTLMAARSRALETGDRTAWLATIADPQGPDGSAEEAAYAGLVALGVRELIVSEVRRSATPATPATPAAEVSQQAQTLKAQTWTGSMRLGYAIPGFDRGVRWVARTVTLTQVAGQWLIQRWVGPADRWEVFDLSPLQVVRSERALVAGPVAQDVLRDRLAEVEVGQDRVAAALGRAFPAVVVVPATTDQAALLLGNGAPSSEQSPLAGQVAATTHGPREPSATAVADRVVLDPQGMGRLTPAGRRVVLTHELTHVSVRAGTLHDLPLWLSEGFAEWVAFRDEGMDVTVVAARLLSQVRASGPPATLPTATDFAGTAGDPAAAYQESWLAASRIATLAGPEGLVGLVRRVGGVPGASRSPAGPVDPAAALTEVLGQTMSQFVAGWQSELVTLAVG
ncbi:MAG: hypothetical protein BWY91_02672 [bacterium ADurb.BinA028]|nr:MAG: hypothetical protein BWY91_02672 [bacterium ADurb.BinA028]